MRILVLGGAGLQGRAAIHDLSNQTSVEEIICGDMDFQTIDNFKEHIDIDRIKKRKIDAGDVNSITSAMKDADVAIDLLPKEFHAIVAEAALKEGVSFVNCSYAYELPDDLDKKAKETEITVMPEAGLDPGIDLVLCGYGVSYFDKVYELDSYCGGIPDKEAADNPLKYKISWNWDSTLKSYKRPAVIMVDGETINITAEDQHSEKWLQHTYFSGIGEMEIIPNGDALVFANILGITDTIQNTARRTIRWKGHASFWKKMMDLGFLSDEPVSKLSNSITPHEFMVAHLGPKLQYESNEKDLVLMRNIIIGEKDGQQKRVTFDLVDRRDLKTGLFAMNRTVGYTASIVAQMIAKGQINQKGVLSPVKDIPYKPFISELNDRGVSINKKEEFI